MTNVSPFGFWLLIEEHERFVPFDRFPWFRDATIAQLTAVELPSPHHLYWPGLDVDLAVESLDHPERYPLVSREQRDDATLRRTNHGQTGGRRRSRTRRSR